MGIMTRKHGDLYVITSDHTAGIVQGKRAPKRMPAIGLAWTGADWSADLADARTFATLDAAEEYTRANYAQLRDKL
jgi:hypothetical protein